MKKSESGHSKKIEEKLFEKDLKHFGLSGNFMSCFGW